MTAAKGAGRGDVTYDITTFISGREGSQSSVVTGKREATRRAKASLADQPFASATSVHMVDARGAKSHRTLIFQAHVAMKKGGGTVVRTDEL